MERLKAILFVDDDQAMLNSLRRAFLEEPYHTLYATSGQDALTILENHKVDVVVSDMKMPGMGGQELLDAISTNHPQIVCILFSGQASIQQQEISTLVKTLNRGEIFKFIGKTINMNTDLREAIQEAVGSH